MRAFRYFNVVILFCLAALPSFAQTTAVSGTVTDLSGLPYAGGQLKAQLVLAGASVTGQPVVTINNNAQCAAAGQGSAPCKVPFQGTAGPLQLDPTGSFNLALQDNTQVTPSGTQWLFSITTNGAPQPLGTGPQACTLTLTISGASQNITSNGLNSCPALSSGNLNSLDTTGTTLSPTCGKAVAPCIQIPAGGGCIANASTTNNSPTVTFTTFPTNPPPVVGEIAWVQTEQGVGINTFCLTNAVPGASYTTNTYCGTPQASGGTPITITAINPGVSITLSQNCNTTQSNANSVFFYMPNIYSQMRTACLGANGTGIPGQSIHVAAGIYGLDNTAFGTQSACGCAQASGCTPNQYSFAHLTGEGIYATQLYTPPWYNHNGDVGTVLAGGILDNIAFDGSWTAIGRTHGTVYSGGGCGSHDFAFVGYSIAPTNGGSETMYNNSVAGPTAGNCEIRNPYILSGDSGIVIGFGGEGTLLNPHISTKNPAVLSAVVGTTNAVFHIIGGVLQSAGSNRDGGNAGVIAVPASGLAVTGDRILVSNAELCMTGNAAAITDTETTGSVILSNVLINNTANSLCTPGTNAGGVTLASGITGYFNNSLIAATGTGNTVAAPAGSTLYQDQITVQNTSGGAGFSGGGTNHHTETGTCTFSAATTCVVTFAQGFGSTPNIFIPPNIPATATTLTISAQSSTQFTITASASNSATVGWSATF